MSDKPLTARQKLELLGATKIMLDECKRSGLSPKEFAKAAKVALRLHKAQQKPK